MLGQKETIDPKIISEVGKLITQRKSIEKHPRIRLL